MKKYNHPLLLEVDYSQAAEPATEMMLALQQQQNSLDFNAYLTKPFETPLFNRVEAIQLDEENERFEFVRADDEMLHTFALAKQTVKDSPPTDSDIFVITMADPTSGLVGGYWIWPLSLHRRRLVFDRLLWDDLGQPLDGRSFRLDCTDCLWLPVVMGMDEAFLLGDDRPYREMVPYFPDQQMAEKLEADFSLRSSDLPECRLASNFDLQVMAAVRRQPGWEGFSFADWQKAKTDMKQQLQSSPTETFLQLSGILPLPTWAAVDTRGELHLCVQIPGRGWAAALSPFFQPFTILSKYAKARFKSDFYRYYPKKTLLAAIKIICTGLGIRSKLKLRDVSYLTQWKNASDIWFGGDYSFLAQILADHRLTPSFGCDDFFVEQILADYRSTPSSGWKMDSPNAHLLRDDEIGQWLPADFEVTDKNKEGLRTFLVGVLNDLRDLTAEQTAEYFQQCLCSKQAQRAAFKRIESEIQLLDLMADGYFDRGICSLSWWFGCNAMDNHARRRYGIKLETDWSSDPLPFSWKEPVALDDFVFQLPESEEECGNACLYCGWQKRGSFPLASGRIPPAIVSLADSPRVPIGIVAPLSGNFELSEEFYETLNEPKEQFNERFKQIIEKYWEIFDKNYPYLY